MAVRLLAFTSVVEVGTGIALILVPAFVVNLLLGFEISADGTLLARCFGIGLLALSVACWPGSRADVGAAPLRGMLIYNAAIALYLGYLGAFAQVHAPLLWPAVALHAVVAMLLIYT